MLSHLWHFPEFRPFSASMCHTPPWQCSSARSRRRETRPQRTVSIAARVSNVNILSCPIWLNFLPRFLLSRDDNRGSGRCARYSHPGADCRHGQRSLHARTWRPHPKRDQLVCSQWPQWLFVCAPSPQHGKQMLLRQCLTVTANIKFTA